MKGKIKHEKKKIKKIKQIQKLHKTKRGKKISRNKNHPSKNGGRGSAVHRARQATCLSKQVKNRNSAPLANFIFYRRSVL
jgi:hypothetical protein